MPFKPMHSIVRARWYVPVRIINVDGTVRLCDRFIIVKAGSRKNSFHYVF